MKLAEIFQNGMVLQRRREIPFRGTLEKAQDVRLVLNGTEVASITAGDVGTDGTFEIILPPQEAMENAEITLEGTAGGQDRSQNERLVLQNVDFGEVWLAGGQSNMDFELSWDAESDKMIAEANDPHFRFYDVGEYAFEGEREENLKADAAYWYRWMPYAPADAGKFSAAGVYFALQLREKLGCPVGVIGVNWGGTKASAWTSREKLLADPYLKFYVEDYDKALSSLSMEKYLKSNYSMRKAASKPERQKAMDKMMKNEKTSQPGKLESLLINLFTQEVAMGPHNENRPAGLYENMVLPIKDMQAAGVIWYQGESDDDHAGLYARLFRTMIECWRETFSQDLPFLFVQLAPFESWLACVGTRYPELRYQQQAVEDTVPDAYMASIMDVGSRYDIHPKKKRPVGERLALLAEKEVYGLDVEAHSPALESLAWNNGELVLHLKNTGGGLEERPAEEELSGVKALLKLHVDGTLCDYDYRIEGENLILKPAGSGGKAEVSFAEMPYCRVNLYGMNGLPVRPFRGNL